MLQKLDELFKEFQNTLNTINTQADVLNLKSEYLGKKGPISDILKGLKNATVEERKDLGPKANQIKNEIQELTVKKLAFIETEAINQKLASEKIDTSLLNSVMVHGQEHGGFHPITKIQQEIEDIFLSMGFGILDGPHIEDEFHNFEALNVPSDHPARDMQDTFWLQGSETPEGERHLLRTHTSCVQVHGMLANKPPFKFIAPGKVFRCERTDASHESVFHQLEGMLVGKDISVGNLIYFMKTLLSEIFKKEVEVRLRPGFFPFVEPGFELDIRCLICNGKGCSVCKQVGWVELLPCGMVHPNVLKAGNIDPNEWNGFAFGLGLDRLVMMRYGIDDIRHLQSGDVRFVSQFKSY
ncbi:MAG: phenylalanine--tRNA ligase subunit alpha [Halobacteriovoraceae bacterium]|jgi:phenylalanyl-tRNA synthetase alpha chain|nr:phenylalanine--tRNA ligase subunit alpha [Halobacteriovoraceae bacterium]MBT5092870.1 phenylalanine--tRNA ligase subunit alpha [Halobacteriovoraceae bacterium]